MAEVKSYKCDICGKVYHRDESETHFMRIVHQPLDDDTKKMFDYEYLCDECTNTVCKVIDNPDIIENYKKNSMKLQGYLCGFKGLLTKISTRIYPFHSFWTSSDDPDCYRLDVDAFIEKYNELETGLDKWKNITKWFIGMSAGMMAGLLISLFI